MNKCRFLQHYVHWNAEYVVVMWKPLFQMFANDFTLSARGKIPVVGTEGVPSYMCTGGVAAYLNWQGSCFRGGEGGMEVLQMLLGDPAKTGVNPNATARARRSVLAQICYKQVIFSSVERNEMVNVQISQLLFCFLYELCFRWLLCSRTGKTRLP